MGQRYYSYPLPKRPTKFLTGQDHMPHIVSGPELKGFFARGQGAIEQHHGQAPRSIFAKAEGTDCTSYLPEQWNQLLQLGEANSEAPGRLIQRAQRLVCCHCFANSLQGEPGL
mmetsp:Transcript_35714/g.76158  ORF Transcript_35714/g.76158 Transcript_35714/m.76158 type:complete len:113 (-) Transcript_35714:1390-1728(-)